MLEVDAMQSLNYFQVITKILRWGGEEKALGMRLPGHCIYPSRLVLGLVRKKESKKESKKERK